MNDFERPGSAPPDALAEMRRVVERAVARIAPPWLANERDDLVQTALLRVVDLDESEESVERPASYLWKAAHSAVMDELRRRRRRRETSLEDLPAGVVETPVGGNVEARRETWTTISAGLSCLSEPRRRAVLLYLLGHTMQESAKILGWTTKQLDNQRHRGLTELRNYLAERGYRP